MTCYPGSYTLSMALFSTEPTGALTTRVAAFPMQLVPVLGQAAPQLPSQSDCLRACISGHTPVVS